MFVVVYSHILFFSIGYEHTSMLTDFLRGFFLNSFFFISGFVGYKATNWNFKSTGNFLYAKTRTILIPTFVSLGIFIFLINGNYVKALLSASKSGYWFTFVLFEMFILYGLFSLLINKVKNNSIHTGLLLLFAFAAYILKKTPIATFEWANSIFCWGGLLYHLPLFLIGIVCRKNVILFHKIIDNNYIKLLLFLIVLLGLKTHWIPLIIFSISSTLFVYSFIKNVFSAPYLNHVKDIAAKIFETIGKNTMQIYFLHFLILFRFPNEIVNYMNSLYSDTCFAGHSCAGIVELLIVGTVSLLISFACILMAKALEQIPYISTLMFGQRKR